MDKKKKKLINSLKYFKRFLCITKHFNLKEENNAMCNSFHNIIKP